jgi:hypothetical protein
VALAALLDLGYGNFVSSLHSNFVVNLDFEGSAPESQTEDDLAASSTDARLMAFAGGRQKFRCTLPSSKRHRPAQGTPEANDVAKFKAHFRNAKLAPLSGRCWTTKKDYWSYEVCFGRKIVQFRQDADAKFSLGEIASEGELHGDGHISETYAGGTDNRSSVLMYACGDGGDKRDFILEEPAPLKYEILITSPSFCSWREKGGLETRSGADGKGKTMLISALLEDLRGNCVNVTQGWWTYEYCYPHSLRQFHQGNGGQREPEHVLGTVNGSGTPTDFGRVKMELVKLKPSISAKERRAPPSNHGTLKQYLGFGTVCDETNRPRTTTMHFQCPPNWNTQSETRIVNINEASLCEYLCGVRMTLHN